MWGILGVPVFLIFIVIAFFEVSEMNLIHYTVKMLKTYVLDTAKKFQVNYPHIDPLDILIKKQSVQEQKKVVDLKENVMDQKLMKQLQNKGLLD